MIQRALSRGKVPNFYRKLESGMQIAMIKPMMNSLENSNGLTNQAMVQGQSAQKHDDRVVLRMKTNDRMGGSVPVWEKVSSRSTGPKGSIENNFNAALQNAQNTGQPNQALAYSPEANTALQNEKPFTFGDLVDMVNPLHHIPLVGHVYREVTGDEIRSSSKIIGGAVFGGGAGAAIGIADAIIEEEMGQDSTGLAMATLRGEELSFKKPTTYTYQEDERSAGLRRYSSSARTTQEEQLPATLLQFTDQTPKLSGDEVWTAGISSKQNSQEPSAVPQYFENRPPVTKLSFSEMPTKTKFSYND
jgi:hypothetical protein